MIITFIGILLLLILALLFRPLKTYKIILAVLILAYVYFLDFRLFSIGGVNIYIRDLAFAAITVYLMFYLLKKSQISSFYKQLSSRFFILFLVWGILSIIRGIPKYGFSAIGEGRFVFYSILFYFITLCLLKNEIRLNDVLKWLVSLVCILPLTNFIAFFIFGGQSSFSERFMDNEMLYSQAQFRFLQAGESIVVAVVAMGLFIYSQAGERRWRGRLLVLFSLLFLAVLITQVRSVWVALVLGLLFTPLIIRKWPVRFLLIVCYMVITLFLMLSLFNIGNNGLVKSISNSAEFLQNPTADETGRLRLFVWQQGWKQIMQNLIIGEGLGSYNDNVDAHGVVINIPLHNGYLTLLLKFGLLGSFLMLTGLGIWFIEMARFYRSESDRHYKLLGGALIIGTFMFVIFAIFYDFTIPFWILLGMGTALVNIRHKYKRRVTPVLIKERGNFAYNQQISAFIDNR